MTGFAKQSIIIPVAKMDCFVANAPRNDDSKKAAARARAGGRFDTISKRRNYFGYLNSGAAFSDSLVVFIDASHLSFLLS
jgi:hypothetical protein